MKPALELPEHLKSIPLKAIRMTARINIAIKLNQKCDSFDRDIGLFNNYIGLAELVGLSNEQIELISSMEDPTKELLAQWQRSSELEPTLGKLWQYLTELKRFDLMTDCKKALEKDAESYQIQREQQVEHYVPVQQKDVSSQDDHYVEETTQLTIKEVNTGVTQYYDAFVCYSQEAKDKRFVDNLIQKLEVERGIKLCIPGRDDLVGGTKYVVDSALIKSRCKMMLIVLSKDYLKSSACDFQSKFAVALSQDTKTKRIIPLLTERMPIPSTFRYMSLCDFTKTGILEWVYERLYRSLKVTMEPHWKDAEMRFPVESDDR